MGNEQVDNCTKLFHRHTAYISVYMDHRSIDTMRQSGSKVVRNRQGRHVSNQ